jgi:TetR/AcrR family transcriptional regulator, transcriptional repressor for nem operon
MTSTHTDHHTSKRKLLDAAVKLIRTKGYTATSIDNLCAETGLTKGGFFHHFKNKEELAVAAAQHWTDTTGPLFEGAPYQKLIKPLDRVLGYVDFRASILQGTLPEFTCLAGTMVQEIHTSNPAIAAACGKSITLHADTLADDIQAVMAASGRHFNFTAHSLALHTQAVLQGAFILAKATGGPDAALESVKHLRRYIELLFNPTSNGDET